MSSHLALLIALCALVPSLALMVAAENARSMLILLIGTAISGVATGLGYCCSWQKINESAPDNRRSELVSAYLIVCYAGISLPVIGVGLVANAMGAGNSRHDFRCFHRSVSGLRAYHRMAKQMKKCRP